MIELAKNNIGVVFLKLTFGDGSIHRTSFSPIVNVDSEIQTINANLTKNNKQALSLSDIDSIKSFCSLTWTPDVIALYQATIK